MKFLFALSGLFFSFLCSAQTLSESRIQEIVFKNVSVVPMDRETVVKNQTVVVKGGVITAIGGRKKVTYSKDALVIDAKGKFLMPGLGEMHGHINSNGDENKGAEILLLYAMNGVTTLRNMLGNPEHLTLRDKVASGEIIGPRVLTAGPQFSGRDIKTEEAGIEQVQKQKKEGYDLLKIKEGLSLSAFEAIAQTAHQEHIHFGGHVPYDVGIFNAARLGFSTVDHLDGIIPALIPGLDTIPEKDLGIFGFKKANRADLSKLDAVLAALRQNDVWVVPTQSFAEHWQSPVRSSAELLQYPEMKYMDRKTLDQWVQMKKGMTSGEHYDTLNTIYYLELRKKIVLECHRKGVNLLAGTDAGQVFMVPGFVLHREMGYLVDAGLTPYEALKTSTYNVGKFLGNEQIGVVKEGAIADLILLEENPLKNIQALDQMAGVMLQGRWISHSEMEAILNKLVK